MNRKGVLIFCCVIIVGSLTWNVIQLNEKKELTHKNIELKRFLQYQKGETEIVQYDLGISRDSVRVLRNHLTDCRQKMKGEE